MSMSKPRIPAPTPLPTASAQATSPAGAGQGSALGTAFSGFRFAPRLSAFASSRSGGRRSLIGGGT